MVNKNVKGKVIYKGVEYNSVRDLCIKNNIKESNIYRKLREGYTLEQAVGEALGEYYKYEYNGKKYKSITELAVEFNISVPQIYKSLSEGKTIEEIVRNYMERKIIIFNKEFDNYESVCKYYSISENLLRYRRNKFETDEEAILSILNEEPIIFEGVEYDSLTKLSMEYGKDLGLVVSRIARGYSLRDALTEEIKKAKTGQEICVRGIKYDSFTAACRNNGISVQLYPSNIQKHNLNISREDFLELILDIKDKIIFNENLIINTTKMIIYGNKKFDDFNSLINYLNIDSREYYAAKEKAKNMGILPNERHKILTLMKNEKTKVYIDKETGKEITPKEAVSKYGNRYKHIGTIKKHCLKEEQRLKYPNMVFDENEYFFDFLHEFTKGLAELLKSNNKPLETTENEKIEAEAKLTISEDIYGI